MSGGDESHVPRTQAGCCCVPQQRRLNRPTVDASEPSLPPRSRRPLGVNDLANGVIGLRPSRDFPRWHRRCSPRPGASFRRTAPTPAGADASIASLSPSSPAGRRPTGRQPVGQAASFEHQLVVRHHPAGEADLVCPGRRAVTGEEQLHRVLPPDPLGRRSAPTAAGAPSRTSGYPNSARSLAITKSHHVTRVSPYPEAVAVDGGDHRFEDLPAALEGVERRLLPELPANTPAASAPGFKSAPV